MANFLRDENIKNYTVTENALAKVYETLNEIVKVENELAENKFKDNPNDLVDNLLLIKFIIRFDRKGFIVYELEEMIKYFKDAKKVERVILNAESFVKGKKIEVCFDVNPSNSNLLVQDNNEQWVNSVFLQLKDVLSKYKNRNNIINNTWTPFYNQIAGLIVILLITFWAAMKTTCYLNVENPFVFSFIIILLILSNVWTPVSIIIMKVINRLWPNIEFKNNNNFTWVWQAVIGSAIFALILWLLGNFGIFLYNSFKTIIK